MQRPSASTHSGWAFALTVIAFFWGLALVAAALLLPAYQGSTASSTGVTSQTSATLVAVNGPRVLVIVALPAVLALIAWWGLHRRCARGDRSGAVMAWAAIAVLAFLSLLAAASIGLFLLPTAVLLIAAARLTPTG